MIFSRLKDIGKRKSHSSRNDEDNIAGDDEADEDYDWTTAKRKQKETKARCWSY